MKALRRFKSKPAISPKKVQGLQPDHPALSEGRTIFPSMVVEPKDSPRLLVSGKNSKKLGSHVVKGPWKGMPIFSLSLEERATCPRSCEHWKTCYGNGTPLARRHKHGKDLCDGLRKELNLLDEKYQKGFVVRLHNLGDFYDLAYCARWFAWLGFYQNLHIFGYTAHKPDSTLGPFIKILNTYHERCNIRFSGINANTLWTMPDGSEDGVVCPAQTGATECCGTCGLCWAEPMKEKNILFIAHGGFGRNKKDAK